jgi:hypothetical protein
MALPRQFVADAVYHVADFLELRVFFEVEENPEDHVALRLVIADALDEATSVDIAALECF